MRDYSRTWPVVMAVCLVLTCVGCPPQSSPDDPQPTSRPPTPSVTEPVSPEPEPAAATPPEPAEEPLEIPEVKLTETHAATCLVKVGDAMPEAELPAVGGAAAPLKESYGEKLTVLFFWTSKSTYATTELEDLTDDVAVPFAERGVSVVGVNEGDTEEVAAAQIQTLQVKFPNFLDADGEFFGKVATEKLPRTYLLDAGGKVLWFDLEYSATTRRDMLQAIEAALAKLSPTPSS